MRILRTPDEQFADLEDFPYAPNYTQIAALRMHHVESGAGGAVLPLHGEPAWSYLYRKMRSGMGGRIGRLTPMPVDLTRQQDQTVWSAPGVEAHARVRRSGSDLSRSRPGSAAACSGRRGTAAH